MTPQQIIKTLTQYGLNKIEIESGRNKIGQARVFGDFSAKYEIETTYTRKARGYKIRQKSTRTGNIEVFATTDTVKNIIIEKIGNPIKISGNILLYK